MTDFVKSTVTGRTYTVDADMCAPRQNETRAKRARLGTKPFDHNAPAHGTSVPLNDTRADNTRKRDRRAVHDSRATDYAVYRTANDTRTLVGTVRKACERVMYRTVTANGFGAWHVLQGYTKRVPNKELHRVFDIPEYVNVYMVDVAQIDRVNTRENMREAMACGPHDRRPQDMNLKARRAW